MRSKTTYTQSQNQSGRGYRMQAYLRTAFVSVVALTFFSTSFFFPTRGVYAQDVDYSEEDGKDLMEIQFDEVEGTPMEEFLKLAQELTGKQLKYDSTALQDKKLRYIGRKVIARDQFWAYFQAVLRAEGFIVVPYGEVTYPNEPGSNEEPGFFSVVEVRGGGVRGGVGGLGATGYIRGLAPVIPSDQLEAFKYDAGLIITTSFTMQYVTAQEVQSMLSGYLTDTTVESARPISQSNSIVTTGYAQTLYGIGRLISLIDIKPDEFKLQFAQTELKHGVAEDIASIVKELIEAETGGGAPGQGGRNPAQQGALPSNMQEPQPVITTDPRTNTILVVAAETTLDKILHYINILDVETDPMGKTHVYRLKNSAAKEMAEVLVEWAEDASQGGTTGGSTAGGSTSTSTTEQPVSIVADEASNSLIINASKSRYAQVLEIIKRLDVRKRQVLLECALVEISGSLDERIGVELGTVGDDGFGVTNFGLSTLTGPPPGSDTEAAIPTGRNPGGFTIGDTGIGGLTAGIFGNDQFSIPFVINALKETTDTNVLSMPSLLVNDNEEAHIDATTEVPTTNTTTNATTASTSFDSYQEAGIELNISPSISAGNYLRLQIKLVVSAFFGTSQAPGIPPPKISREIESSVTLPDAHTMVMGGVVTDDLRVSESAVPWFGDLPFMGWLFGTAGETDTATNLYVFITPHIIDDDFSNLDELSYLKKKEMEILNGKIELLDPDWDRNNANNRMLDAAMAGIFDLPSYVSPPAGEVDPEVSAPEEAVAPPTEEGTER